MITQEDILKAYTYEADTGMLRRVGGRKDYPWRQIGTGGKYLATGFMGKTLYAHRMVWMYHYGYWPRYVDHIDRDTKNNRVENLRECTQSQNNYNSTIKSNNKCGYKGVRKIEKLPNNPWEAKIVVAGKIKILGYYSTPEAAHEAYLTGAQKYAKEFARGR